MCKLFSPSHQARSLNDLGRGRSRTVGGSLWDGVGPLRTPQNHARVAMRSLSLRGRSLQRSWRLRSSRRRYHPGSENVDLRPPHTPNNAASLSDALSLSNGLQTPSLPSSSEVPINSLDISPVQNIGPADTDDIHLPSDLMGQVTRSDSHPFTSGGFGNIYRGDLDLAGRLINVSDRSFLPGNQTSNQGGQVVLAAR